MKKSNLLLCIAVLVSASALYAGLTVVSPTHGDKWLLGSNKTVTFTTDTPYGDIHLLLYRNGVKIGFVKCGFPSGVPAGTYNVPWKVGKLTSPDNCSTPLTAAPNTMYVIRFTQHPDGSGLIATSRFFSIIKPILIPGPVHK